MTVMNPNRRRFLQTTMSAAAGAVVGPSFLARSAYARTAAFGSVKHLIILFAQGGLRSHCLFNAVGTEQFNPYGVQDAAEGTEWALGAVCGRADIVTESLGTVPGFHQISNEVAILASVDHDPRSPPHLDHDPAVAAAATGSSTGRQGLLARIMEHPRYDNGIGRTTLPPVDIGDTAYGQSSTNRVPLKVAAPGALVPQRAIGKSWATEIREQLNARFAERTTQPFLNRTEIARVSKSNAFDFSELLVDPVLNVLGAPEATAHGLTNGQLLEVLGDVDLQSLGDRESNRSWGPDVALALRWIGFGAPAVALRRDIYDTHSNERGNLPVRTQDLVRQMAGLNHLLKMMPHPEGDTFWDHSLVVVTSEFSRNNTEPESGFNSGLGSDHVRRDVVARNQAIALMGGALGRSGAGGKQFGSTTEEMLPNGTVHTTRALHTTLLDGLGVDKPAEWREESPIEGLLA